MQRGIRDASTFQVHGIAYKATRCFSSALHSTAAPTIPSIPLSLSLSLSDRYPPLPSCRRRRTSYSGSHFPEKKIVSYVGYSSKGEAIVQADPSGRRMRREPSIAWQMRAACHCALRTQMPQMDIARRRRLFRVLLYFSHLALRFRVMPYST